MNPTLPNHGMRPAAAAVCQAPGNWRLDQLPKASFPLLALLVSAGFHAAFLLAFNGHAPRIIRFAPPTVPTSEPWPVVPNDPEPPPTDIKALDDPPVVSIPRLADLPSRLDLQNDFVQKLEPNAPLPEIKGDRVLKIPIHAGNGGPRALPPDTFSPDQLDRAPRVVAQTAPHYPREMQNLAISAEVVVEFIVDTTGAVQSARIVSSTHPGFDRAALDGVRRWKFRPGLKDGRKVNTRMLQPIRFSLDEHPGA
ncbi:MAG TPA: TonB family protein [Candidatus Limnocylindria bacterium]|jgi:protein TonB|nr:TonB family protein [Candidatus Limnocylindria bacterium]HTL67180.1 TonB family protein [Lacunisphaera sp.]